MRANPGVHPPSRVRRNHFDGADTHNLCPEGRDQEKLRRAAKLTRRPIAGKILGALLIGRSYEVSAFNKGFVIFPQLTQLDFTGPLQVLARLPIRRRTSLPNRPTPCRATAA